MILTLIVVSIIILLYLLYLYDEKQKSKTQSEKHKKALENLVKSNEERIKFKKIKSMPISPVVPVLPSHVYDDYDIIKSDSAVRNIDNHQQSLMGNMKLSSRVGGMIEYGSRHIDGPLRSSLAPPVDTRQPQYEFDYENAPKMIFKPDHEFLE